MTQARDILLNQLSCLRADANIRDFLAKAEAALRSERWLMSAIEPPRAYSQVVKEAVHCLARDHIAFYVADFFREGGSAVPPTTALVSFSSSFGVPRARLTDYKCDALSTCNDAQFVPRLERELKTGWQEGLAQASRRFELHELAQRRVRMESSPAARIPVYVCPCTTQPSWLDTSGGSGDEQLNQKNYSLCASHLILDRSRNAPVASLICLPLHDLAQSSARLEAAYQYLKNIEDPGEKSIDDPNRELERTHYDAYVSYLSKLLNYGTPQVPSHLCLCTIAVSDELSNLRLGSVMLFSEDPCLPLLAAGIHDLCHDFFDALYKIEMAAHIRQETSLSVTRWLAHEVSNWASCLANAVKPVEDALKQDDVRREGKVKVEAVRTCTDNVRAVAISLPSTADFLRQFMRNANATVLIQEFEAKLHMAFSAQAPAYVERLTFTSRMVPGKTIPVGLLLAALELTRNAYANKDQYLAKDWRVSVDLFEERGSLVLQVDSAPQDEDGIRKLRDAVRGADGAERGLGIRLIKQVVATLGGALTTEGDEPGRGIIRCELPMRDGETR